MSARIAAAQFRKLKWAITPIPEKCRGVEDLPMSFAIERLPIRRKPEVCLKESNSIGAERRAISCERQCAIPDISVAGDTRHSSRTQRRLGGIANPPTRLAPCGGTMGTFYKWQKRGGLGAAQHRSGQPCARYGRPPC